MMSISRCPVPQLDSSAQELRLGMKHLGIDLEAKEIAKLIEVMDANRDGSIDWNEFDAMFGDAADSKKGAACCA